MHLVARRAAEFGVEVEGPVRFHLDRAVARKDGIVQGIVESIHGALRQRQDAIDFVPAEARFVSAHEVDTGDRRLSFGKAIIATGARRAEPAIPGLETVDYLTNRSALELDRLPSSLIVIGGGYVGIEFAQMYARFGSRVTLLGRNPHLAPGEDSELSDLLQDYLREEAVEVHTGAAVSSVRPEGNATVVVALIEGAEREFRADALLVATGRIGNTDGLDLPAAGVETEGKGFIRVDEELKTSQPHIWAIGDVKGGWMFTHVATYDGPMAALNAVKGADRSVDYRVVPRAIFSDPTLAAVGLTEHQARSRGYDVAVGSVPADGARALAIGNRRGRLKAVVNAKDGEILGFHILAPHGDDLLHEAVAAMYARGSIERISKSIHVHPTLSEMVKSAARAAK
jgi:pyruvate/2-oxoglutarate dehydrogenase complex dihydrolipoamide dehydrogenase (E3) component